MASFAGWIRKRLVSTDKAVKKNSKKNESVSCSAEPIAENDDALESKGDQCNGVEATPPRENKIFQRDIDAFLKMDKNAVAREITMMNWNVYRNITREDIEEHEITPSEIINEMNENYQQVYNWTVDTVLSAEEMRVRCKVIRHFILIADALLYTNDLNGAHSVIAALHSFAIQRLDKTWRNMSSNKMKMLKKLNKLFSEQDNYYKLTEHMRSVHFVNNICIPYLALFLRDFEATRYLEHDKRILTLRRNAVVLEDVEKLKQFRSENSPASQLSSRLRNSMNTKMISEVEANERSRVLEAPKRFYRILNLSDINLAED